MVFDWKESAEMQQRQQKSPSPPTTSNSNSNNAMISTGGTIGYKPFTFDMLFGLSLEQPQPYNGFTPLADRLLLSDDRSSSAPPPQSVPSSPITAKPLKKDELPFFSRHLYLTGVTELTMLTKIMKICEVSSSA